MLEHLLVLKIPLKRREKIDEFSILTGKSGETSMLIPTHTDKIPKVPCHEKEKKKKRRKKEKKSKKLEIFCIGGEPPFLVEEKDG